MCGYVYEWICVHPSVPIRTEHPIDLVGLSPCLYESMDHPPTYGICVDILIYCVCCYICSMCAYDLLSRPYS